MKIEAIICFCFIATCCAQSVLPNLSSLGAGFDMLYSGDSSEAVHTLSPIFDFGPTSSYKQQNGLLIPQNTTLVNSPYYDCTGEAEVKSVKSVSDFLAISKSASSSSVGVKVWIASFGGSKSKKFASVANSFFESDEFEYFASTNCKIYDIAMLPDVYRVQPLSAAFRSAISFAPNNFNVSSIYNIGQWYKIIKRFGTHFTYRLQLGGIVQSALKISYFDDAKFSATVQQSSSTVSWGFKYYIGVKSSHGKENEQELAAYKQFSQLSVNLCVKWIGGMQDNKNITYFNWIKTLESNPAPTHVYVSPLPALLTATQFPSISNIKDKQLALLEAINFYAQRTGTLLPIYPQPTVTYSQLDSTSNSVYFSFDSKCSGSKPVLIGGGCFNPVSEDLSKAPYFLAQSYPIVEGDGVGWRCLSHKDMGSGRVDALTEQNSPTALCSPSTLPSSILGVSVPPAINISSKIYQRSVSINNVGQHSISSPSCPSDYFVSSGGCSATSENSNYHRLTKSAPGSNNWLCSTSVDMEMVNGRITPAAAKNPKLTAYVVCSKYDINTSILKYMGSHLPNNKTTVISTSGNGQSFTSAVAKCPPGFIVTGGGCDGTVSSSNKPFSLVQSYPASLDSWGCYAAQDSMSGGTNEAVKATAICIQLQPDHELPPAEDPTNQCSN